MLTLDQRRFLLGLARNAIAVALAERRLPTSECTDEDLHAKRGAFVTLTQGGELRGCIGFIEAIYPLYETVIRGGVSAAFQDPRFPPVTPEELAGLQIEISVLSPLAPIRPEEVVVGTHGLVVERGPARGLLLPQVPVEWGWTREEFLAHTCRKAGLPLDSWRHDATLSAFTAEVFNEAEVAEVPHQ